MPLAASEGIVRVGTSASAAVGRRMWSRRMRGVWPYLWVLPALLVYATFNLAPLLGGVWLALLRWDGIEPAEYVGLQNFRRVLHDQELLTSLTHNLQYAVGTVVGKIVLSLGLALLLNQSLRGRVFYRTALFMPVVMSFVVVGILWSWIYSDQFGLVNSLLREVHLDRLAYDWLGDTRVALWSLILVDIWKWYGFHMVIFLAGLQAIPTEFYEAARLDGASALRQLTGITLPLLKPVMLVNVTLSLVGALNVFDIPYVMTEGGPAGATKVLALDIYLQAFKFNKIGYGAALSYTLLVGVTIVALVQIGLMSRNTTEM
jgi:ABC-type sugar transport system permease subunit